MRIVRIFLITVAALLLLFVGASVAAYFLVDLDALATRQVQKRVPELEKRLGRKVSVGPVSASFFPRLAAGVESVEIGDAAAVPEAERRPLLKIREITVRLELLPVLLSMGKEVKIDVVTIEGLEASIVRAADGRLSYQDLLEEKDTPLEPAPAPGEEKPADLSNISLGALVVRDASIHFEDRATGGAPVVADVTQLNLRVTPVAVETPIAVTLDMAAFAPATNFHLEAELGPVPRTGEVEEPLALLRSLQVRSDGVELARLSPYLGESLPLKLDAARLVSDLKIDLAPGQPVVAKGFLELQGAQVHGGEKFDLALRPDLDFDEAKGELNVRSFELALGTVKLTAKGRVAGIGKGLTGLRLDGVEVHSDTLDVGQLLRYWPLAEPPLTTVGAGRLDLKVSGDPSAQTIAGMLDLTAPRVIVPGTLDKPAGVPMAAEIAGAVDPQAAKLSKVELRFGPVAVSGTAEIQGYNSPAPRTILDLTSNTWSFGEVARLVPAVQRGLPAGATVGGQGTVALKWDGTPAQVDLDATLALSAVDLSMPGTRLAGGAHFTAKVKGAPDTDLSIDAALDASDATIVVEGTMNKPAGVPLNAELKARRQGPLLDVQRVALLLGALRIEGAGTMNQATSAIDMRLSMPPLDLGELSKTFPAVAGSGLAGGVISTKLAMDGNPERTETLALVLSDFRYALGKNLLTGTVRLQNPTSPKVVAELESPHLNLDEVMPPSAEEKARTAQRKKGNSIPKPPPCEPPSETMKAMDADVKVSIAEGVVSEIPFRDLHANVEMHGGVISIKEWSLQAYGGKLVGRGTRIDRSTCVGEYMADLTLEGMDLGQLLAAQTSLGSVLHGKLSGRVVVNGKGLDRYYMTSEDPAGRRLSGVIESQIADGAWEAGSLAQAALGPVAALVPGLSAKGEKGLGSIASSFDVKAGRFVLAEPMVIGSGGSRTELTGSIGMDHTLALTGTYLAKAALITQATGGRCKLGKDLPIPITIGGNLKSPRFSAVDAARPAATIATACLGGKAAAALQDKLGSVLGDVKTVDDAKAKIEAAKDELGKKTDAQKKATEKKAKGQARKAAKKVLKGIGF